MPQNQSITGSSKRKVIESKGPKDKPGRGFNWKYHGGKLPKSECPDVPKSEGTQN